MWKATNERANRVVCQWMVGTSGACDATSAARVEYAYDAADCLTHEIQDGRDVNYAYDAAGNRTLIQWPDGKAAAYSYTARHQLAGVSFEAVALAAYSYDVQGRATGAVFGNGNSAGVEHEVDDDLSALEYALKDEAGASQALEWLYTYTDAHRLASASVTLPAHDWSPPANVTTSYSAPSLAPGLPGEAANAVGLAGQREVPILGSPNPVRQMLRHQIVSPGDIGDDRTGRNRLGHDPPLLRGAPPAPANHARHFAMPNVLRAEISVDHSVHTSGPGNRPQSSDASAITRNVGSKHRLRPIASSASGWWARAGRAMRRAKPRVEFQYDAVDRGDQLRVMPSLMPK